jgi:hypothetical protein
MLCTAPHEGQCRAFRRKYPPAELSATAVMTRGTAVMTYGTAVMTRGTATMTNGRAPSSERTVRT